MIRFALVCLISLSSAVWALDAEVPAPTAPKPPPKPAAPPKLFPATIPGAKPPEVPIDVPPVQVSLTKNAFTRDEAIRGTVKLAKPPADGFKLLLRWRDCFGRVVSERPLTLKPGEKEITFELPAAPAFALGNTIEAVVADAATEYSAATDFIATPDFAPWDDYTIMMYYSYNPEFQPRLRELNINAGMNQRPSRLLDATNEKTKIWWGYGYRFYAEQILTEIYAQYHRYIEGDKPKDFYLIQAKELYKKDRTKKDAFFRNPCFSDPDVRKKIEETMTKAVEINKKVAPVFYSLADEAGVANLPSAWDFCFDPRTLTDMRAWLKEQYKTLDALNAEWGTIFGAWEEVTPLSTDEMMKRLAAANDDNFSAWADHRTFMEKVFADAVKWGTDATLKADPHAYVGLVGCQMPSAFGGYDYWRLSQSMNAIEPYNFGNNREIWRSFSPEAPAITTSFGHSPQETWRLWYQLLHGDRGIIIYDEKHSYLDDKGEPTELGKKAGAVYGTLTNGICKLISNVTHVNDPIMIHYSQASIHAHWMIETLPEGEAWVERGSATERLRSEFLRLRESFTKLIEDQQLQYTFIAYAQLERGDLEKAPPKLLYLPQSIAMSAAEVAAVRKYVENGGILVADSRCALMDEHCKRLEKGQLDDLFGIVRSNQTWKPGEKLVKPQPDGAQFGFVQRDLKFSTVEPGLKIDPDGNAVAAYTDAAGVPAVIVHQAGKGRAIYLNLDVVDYHRWRLKPAEAADARELFTQLSTLASIAPAITVTRANGDALPGVEVHTYSNGAQKIVAIQQNPQLRINELGPPEYQSNDVFQKDEDVSIQFGAAYDIYDTLKGNYISRTSGVTTKLNAYEPLIFALNPQPVGELTVEAPAKVKRGEPIAIVAKLNAPAAPDACAFHVDILDAANRPIPCYSRNVKTVKGAATFTLYLALNDAAGAYTISIRDVATGVTGQKVIEVE